MRRIRLGLDRGRTTGIYMTLRHEALIVELAARYSRRRRQSQIGSPVSNSQVVQLLVEREARRLKIVVPELPVPEIVDERRGPSEEELSAI